MSEYISREAVLAKSKNMYPSIDHYCVSQHVVTCEDIYNIPAADVAPVVRGEWIYRAWRPTCSLCGFSGSLIDAPMAPFKYCPNCGAKMVEEE